MLRIGCLINSPSVIQDLTDQVKFYIHDALSNNKRVDAFGIYQKMRKDKIEIDFESFGMLYDNIATQLDPTRALLTDIDDINKKAKKSFEAALGAVRTGTGKDKINEIGVDSPERFIGNAIARMLASSTSTTTLMAKLQKAVMAKTNEALGVKTTLSVVPQTAMEQMTNSIAKALELKRSNDTYGVLRQSITLIQAVDKELERMVDELNASGDHAQAAELQNLANDFKSSVTDFLLTKGETKVMAENMLKAMGFMKTNGAIKWDSILNHGAQEFVFSVAEFDKNVRRMLNDPNLGLNVSPSEVDFIAQALTTKYKEIVTEKLAKEGKTTPGVIEKLLKYQALIDEQPDSAILQENYAATLTKALGLDENEALAKGAQMIELSNLFRALGKTNAVNTLIVRNQIDRNISLIIDSMPKTKAKKLGQFFENLMSVRNLALLNPYNIGQNISSGIEILMASTNINNKNNLIGVINAGVDVAKGGVDTVRGQHDINAQTEVRDRASATWKQGTLPKNLLMTPLRISSLLQDMFLGAPDAVNTTYQINDFINSAVEKYFRANSANPDADIADYYSAFNDPVRIAEINTEAERIAKVLGISSETTKTRLKNEIMRGNITTEKLSMNKSRMLIDAANIHTKMMHGKENNTSILSFIPEKTNFVKNWLEEKNKSLKAKVGQTDHLASMLARFAAWGMQWVAAGERWTIIALDISGLRLLEIAGDKTLAFFKNKPSSYHWTETTPEAVKEALNNTNYNTGMRELAEMQNKDARRNMGIKGLAVQIAAVTILLAMESDDDGDDDWLTDEEGWKKFLKRLSMSFPVFYTIYAYTHARKGKSGTKALMEAALDIAGARYPSNMENMKSALIKREFDNVALATYTSDMYSVNVYESIRSWYNFVVPVDKELKKRTKATNLKEALFHTGMARALFEPILVEEEDNRYIFKKKD